MVICSTSTSCWSHSCPKHLSCFILQIIKFTSACERKRGILPSFPPPFTHSASTRGFVLIEWKRAELTKVCLCKWSSFHSVAVIKDALSRRSSGEGRVYLATLPGHSPSLKSGEEQRALEKRWMLIHSHLFMGSAQLALLHSPGSPSPRDDHGPLWSGQWRLSSQMTLDYVRLTVKLSGMGWGVMG